MEYRTLGRSGLKVSQISLGSWITFARDLPQEQIEKVMHAAYDSGINFYDGAEAYGGGSAEKAMGRVFKNAGWERESLVISTKVFGGPGDWPTQKGTSRKHLVESVNAALKRMDLDYVDLCFCHRPDPDTPLEEVVHTMNEMIERGKVFYWGTSMFSASDIQAMAEIARRDGLVGPTMEQPVHNMFTRHLVEKHLKPAFEKVGIGTTIFSPLAQGLLSGKYNDDSPGEGRLSSLGDEGRQRQLNAERLEKVKKITKIANDELGCTTAQLALAWCLKNPNVSTCLTGASRPEQVQDNAKAVEFVERINDDLMERLEGILDNKPD